MNAVIVDNLPYDFILGRPDIQKYKLLEEGKIPLEGDMRVDYCETESPMNREMPNSSIESDRCRTNPLIKRDTPNDTHNAPANHTSIQDIVLDKEEGRRIVVPEYEATTQKDREVGEICLDDTDSQKTGPHNNSIGEEIANGVGRQTQTHEGHQIDNDRRTRVAEST